MYNYGKIFKNCLHVDDTEIGLKPQRLTEKQLKYYESENENYNIRARCNAGVKMEFILSDPSFSFDFKATGFCREHITFDIYENDVLCKNISFENKQTEGTLKYDKLCPTETKIEVYLPYTCDVHISNFSAGEIKYTEDKTFRYLALGDSITQGMDGLYSSMNYPAIIARYLDAYLINQGIGGEKFNHLGFDENIPFKPDLITVAYGTNDYNSIKDLNQIKENVILYFNKLDNTFKGIPIYVITPIWRKNASTDEELALLNEVRKIISDIAGSKGYKIIDGTKLVPNDEKYYGDFLLHPSDLGFHEYAINLLKELK